MATSPAPWSAQLSTSPWLDQPGLAEALAELGEAAERYVILLHAEAAERPLPLRGRVRDKVTGKDPLAAAFNFGPNLLLVAKVGVEPGIAAGDEHQPVGAGVAAQVTYVRQVGDHEPVQFLAAEQPAQPFDSPRHGDVF